MNEKHIFPFFWQHGENHEILADTLKHIRECGVEAICVEARPHPDFGEKGWWKDLDFIMAYARKHQMQVWLLDDDQFPTGHANGAFDEGRHSHGNRFLTQWHVDIKGPAENYTVLAGNVLHAGDRYLGAAALRRPDADQTAVDLEHIRTEGLTYAEGLLRVTVPEGFWRIFFFYETAEGDGKTNRINMLDTKSVRVLLEQVYEPHYERYQEDFGKTFRGFFSDEPEFGNLPGYDFQAAFDPAMRFLPWSEELEVELKTVWNGMFPGCMAALWYEGEGVAAIRYTYMDRVTSQLEKAFSMQIAGWCHERGVTHIGHIIEDDNSHGRLGCSTGHYFRSMRHMGMAGIDVVLLQIMPGFNRRVHQWPVSEYDGEFFHFGLAKLAASLAQITPQMHGRALCEIFGAYGWQEDVALMKWLADHMMSRGINYFVPHAFSPAPFPDPDCPPHFYAQGNQSQFVHFQRLTRYMDRICTWISGGKAVGKTAVLYHADMEWAGTAMLYQKPLRALMEQQLECEVIPVDALLISAFIREDERCRIQIGGQIYEYLVIPESDYIPEKLEKWLKTALEEGFPISFAGRVPGKVCFNTCVRDTGHHIRQIPETELSEVGQMVAEQTGRNIRLTEGSKDLRTYLYRREGGYTLLCFMEGTESGINTKICIRTMQPEDVIFYDAWNDRYRSVEAEYTLDSMCFALMLRPGEMKVFLIGDFSRYSKEPEAADDADSSEERICTFEVTAKAAGESDKDWKRLGFHLGYDLPDLTEWAAGSRFSGIIRYQTTISLSKEKKVYLKLPDAMMSVGVYMNGQEVELRSGVPYEFDCMGRHGDNDICIDLYTTPVFMAADDRSVYAALPPLGIRRISIYC